MQYNIFRLEHASGRGIYIDSDIGNMIHNNGSCPGPNSESFSKEWNKLPNKERINYLFGFNSVKQLISWFPVQKLLSSFKIIKEMEDNSETIDEIIIKNLLVTGDDNILIGNKQVAFNKKFSTVINTYKIDEFLKVMNIDFSESFC